LCLLSVYQLEMHKKQRRNEVKYEFSEVNKLSGFAGKKYGVPANDCKIMKDHEVIYRHKTGYSDYDKTKPVSENDLYRLYSATKVITMIAVLQLVEDKKIGLYDTVDKYLPEFAVMKVADHFEWDKFP
jgi:CubicO group peptidase (beta-lactamase class C family)